MITELVIDLPQVQLVRVSISRPIEIAQFSITNGQLFLDDRELRYYCPPSLPAELDAGYTDKYMRKQDQPLATTDTIINVLERLQDDSIKHAGFVTFRGILKKILCAYFAIENDFDLRATCRHNTIFIDEIKHSQPQSEQGDKFCYYGYKFESLCTLHQSVDQATEHDLNERSRATVNPNNEFCSIAKLIIGGHECVIAAEVDCKSQNDYIELKTNKLLVSSRDKKNFYTYKLPGIWAQSFLIGIPMIVIGFRDKGMLKSVQKIETFDIPNMLRQFRSNLNPLKGLSFLAHVLTVLKDVVKENQHWTLSFRSSKIILKRIN